MLPEPSTAPLPSTGDEPWLSVCNQALSLASALRTLATSQAEEIASACLTSATLVDEIARMAEARGKVPFPARWTAAPTPGQLQDFGRLVRDKRNQAGFSRVQLARRAKLSDATVKFIETARHPPSRATLLRLIGVPELGLRWSDTPGARTQPPPSDLEAAESSPAAAELHRFDSRLSLSMVLESLLVLDELRACQALIEITAYGVRRACCLCGMRSEAWAVDAREAAKLPIRHAAPCPGQLVESLCQRHPIVAELAQTERRNPDSPTAAQLDAGRRAAQVEHFHGCRSSREVAAQLALVAALPATPYRQGVCALWLWALALGPCPLDPTTDVFSERRAQQLADLVPSSSLPARESSRLRGISAAAAWLLSPAAGVPDAPARSPSRPGPDVAHVSP